MLLIIAAICLYFYYLAAHFIPGISSLVDMATKNYVTDKMTYGSSFMANQRFAPRARGKSSNQPSHTRIMNEAYYLKVILAALYTRLSKQGII